MAVYYLDAIAAVKAYLEERGADRVEGILNHAEEVCLTAPCIRLEPYARRAISHQRSAISKNKKLTADS